MMGKYPDDVVQYMKRIYLARVFAAMLCAPNDDEEDDEKREEDENGIFIEPGN